MGDRAIAVCRTDDWTEISPVAYTHWGGSEMKQTIERAAPRMRKGDISYAFARLLGTMHEGAPGVLGIGCFNGPKDRKELCDKKFSHGDAGVFVVNVDTGEVEQFHGYPPGGLPDDMERGTPENPVRFKVELTLQP